MGHESIRVPGPISNLRADAQNAEERESDLVSMRKRMPRLCRTNRLLMCLILGSLRPLILSVADRTKGEEDGETLTDSELE